MRVKCSVKRTRGTGRGTGKEERERKDRSCGAGRTWADVAWRTQDQDHARRDRGMLLCASSSSMQNISTLAEAVLTEERSAVSVAEEVIANVEHRDPSLHCFIHFDKDKLLRDARDIDGRVAEGSGAEGQRDENAHSDLRLAGVPIALKDNLCTSTMPTTAGSKMLEHYVPPYDAVVVRRLKQEGAMIVGKTNLDAFGMGSSTENSDFFVTRNPVDETRVAGGSSGGSAAAVTADLCYAAIGTDTGGSIRQPASFCGAVGLKPSYGRVPRHGLISYASSLDTIGPLTKNVRDCALVFDVIAGESKLDATSVKNDGSSLPYLEDFPSKPLLGRRIGIIKETFGDGLDSGVHSRIMQAISRLDALGATVAEVSIPSFHLGLPAYYVIATSEASSNLSKFDGIRFGTRVNEAHTLEDLYCETRAKGFGAEVKRRILMGTYALSAGYYDAYYKRAQQVRAIIGKELEHFLGDSKAADVRYDCLVCPAAPTPAYEVGEKSNDPLSMYLGDLMTVNASLVGVPAIVVPTESQESSLPVGMQLIGKMFGEKDLLQIAHAYEMCS